MAITFLCQSLSLAPVLARLNWNPFPAFGALDRGDNHSQAVNIVGATGFRRRPAI